MKNGEQSAFPLDKALNDVCGSTTNPLGLTKREYMATKLLASVMLGYDLMTREEKDKSVQYLMETYGKNSTIGESLTKNALAFTDELLKQLSE